MIPAPPAAPDERTWDLLSREEEVILAWIRDRWEALRDRGGPPDFRAFLAGLRAEGAVERPAATAAQDGAAADDAAEDARAVPAPAGAAGTAHQLCRHGVGFSVEWNADNPAAMTLRFGGRKP
jgi:hypothetical protein